MMQLRKCVTCGADTLRSTQLCPKCTRYLRYGAEGNGHKSVDLMAGTGICDHHYLALTGRYANRHDDPFERQNPPLKWLTDAALARRRAMQADTQMELF